MKRNDPVFIVLITLSAAVFSLLITDNVRVSLHTVRKAARTEADLPDDPTRSAVLKKKFEDLGLPLHEGKFWKKYEPATEPNGPAAQERLSHVPR